MYFEQTNVTTTTGAEYKTQYALAIEPHYYFERFQSCLMGDPGEPWGGPWRVWGGIPAAYDNTYMLSLLLICDKQSLLTCKTYVHSLSENKSVNMKDIYICFLSDRITTAC